MARQASPRWVDWLFAASTLWWAWAPAVEGQVWLTPVRVAVMGLHIEVAALFLVRSPLGEAASMREMLVSLPSLVVGGLAFSLAPMPHLWPDAPAVIFVVAAGWTGISLGWLGQNFAILPGTRGCTRGGPYRLVRHPAYLGEFVMLVACSWAAGAWSWLLVPLALATLIGRIVAEERALQRANDQWRAYRDRVRWRLAPGFW